jgi:hypothetical protein
VESLVCVVRLPIHRCRPSPAQRVAALHSNRKMADLDQAFTLECLRGISSGELAPTRPGPPPRRRTRASAPAQEVSAHDVIPILASDVHGLLSSKTLVQAAHQHVDSALGRLRAAHQDEHGPGKLELSVRSALRHQQAVWGQRAAAAKLNERMRETQFVSPRLEDGSRQRGDAFTGWSISSFLTVLDDLHGHIEERTLLAILESLGRILQDQPRLGLRQQSEGALLRLLDHLSRISRGASPALASAAMSNALEIAILHGGGVMLWRVLSELCCSEVQDDASVSASASVAISTTPRVVLEHMKSFVASLIPGEFALTCQLRHLVTQAGLTATDPALPAMYLEAAVSHDASTIVCHSAAGLLALVSPSSSTNPSALGAEPLQILAHSPIAPKGEPLSLFCLEGDTCMLLQPPNGDSFASTLELAMPTLLPTGRKASLSLDMYRRAVHAHASRLFEATDSSSTDSAAESLSVPWLQILDLAVQRGYLRVRSDSSRTIVAVRIVSSTELIAHFGGDEAAATSAVRAWIRGDPDDDTVPSLVLDSLAIEGSVVSVIDSWLLQGLPIPREELLRLYRRWKESSLRDDRTASFSSSRQMRLSLPQGLISLAPPESAAALSWNPAHPSDDDRDGSNNEDNDDDADADEDVHSILGRETEFSDEEEEQKSPEDESQPPQDIRLSGCSLFDTIGMLFDGSRLSFLVPSALWADSAAAPSMVAVHFALKPQSPLPPLTSTLWSSQPRAAPTALRLAQDPWTPPAPPDAPSPLGAFKCTRSTTPPAHSAAIDRDTLIRCVRALSGRAFELQFAGDVARTWIAFSESDTNTIVSALKSTIRRQSYDPPVTYTAGGKQYQLRLQPSRSAPAGLDTPCWETGMEDAAVYFVQTNALTKWRRAVRLVHRRGDKVAFRAAFDSPPPSTSGRTEPRPSSPLERFPHAAFGGPEHLLGVPRSAVFLRHPRQRDTEPQLSEAMEHIVGAMYPVADRLHCFSWGAGLAVAARDIQAPSETAKRVSAEALPTPRTNEFGEPVEDSPAAAEATAPVTEGFDVVDAATRLASLAMALHVQNGLAKHPSDPLRNEDTLILGPNVQRPLEAVREAVVLLTNLTSRPTTRKSAVVAGLRVLSGALDLAFLCASARAAVGARHRAALHLAQLAREILLLRLPLLFPDLAPMAAQVAILSGAWLLYPSMPDLRGSLCQVLDYERFLSGAPLWAANYSHETMRGMAQAWKVLLGSMERLAQHPVLSVSGDGVLLGVRDLAQDCNAVEMALAGLKQGPTWSVSTWFLVRLLQDVSVDQSTAHGPLFLALLDQTGSLLAKRRSIHDSTSAARSDVPQLVSVVLPQLFVVVLARLAGVERASLKAAIAAPQLPISTEPQQALRRSGIPLEFLEGLATRIVAPLAAPPPWGDDSTRQQLLSVATSAAGYATVTLAGLTPDASEQASSETDWLEHALFAGGSSSRWEAVPWTDAATIQQELANASKLLEPWISLTGQHLEQEQALWKQVTTRDAAKLVFGADTLDLLAAAIAAPRSDCPPFVDRPPTSTTPPTTSWLYRWLNDVRRQFGGAAPLRSSQATAVLNVQGVVFASLLKSCCALPLALAWALHSAEGVPPTLPSTCLTLLHMTLEEVQAALRPFWDLTTRVTASMQSQASEWQKFHWGFLADSSPGFVDPLVDAAEHTREAESRLRNALDRYCSSLDAVVLDPLAQFAEFFDVFQSAAAFDAVAPASPPAKLSAVSDIDEAVAQVCAAREAAWSARTRIMTECELLVDSPALQYTCDCFGVPFDASAPFSTVQELTRVLLVAASCRHFTRRSGKTPKPVDSLALRLCQRFGPAAAAATTSIVSATSLLSIAPAVGVDSIASMQLSVSAPPKRKDAPPKDSPMLGPSGQASAIGEGAVPDFSLGEALSPVRSRQRSTGPPVARSLSFEAGFALGLGAQSLATQQGGSAEGSLEQGHSLVRTLTNQRTPAPSSSLGVSQQGARGGYYWIRKQLLADASEFFSLPPRPHRDPRTSLFRRAHHEHEAMVRILNAMDRRSGRARARAVALSIAREMLTQVATLPLNSAPIHVALEALRTLQQFASAGLGRPHPLFSLHGAGHAVCSEVQAEFFALTKLVIALLQRLVEEVPSDADLVAQWQSLCHDALCSCGWVFALYDAPIMLSSKLADVVTQVYSTAHALAPPNEDAPLAVTAARSLLDLLAWTTVLWNAQLGRAPAPTLSKTDVPTSSISSPVAGKPPSSSLAAQLSSSASAALMQTRMLELAVSHGLDTMGSSMTQLLLLEHVKLRALAISVMVSRLGPSRSDPAARSTILRLGRRLAAMHWVQDEKLTLARHASGHKLDVERMAHTLSLLLLQRNTAAGQLVLGSVFTAEAISRLLFLVCTSILTPNRQGGLVGLPVFRLLVRALLGSLLISAGDWKHQKSWCMALCRGFGLSDERPFEGYQQVFKELVAASGTLITGVRPAEHAFPLERLWRGAKLPGSSLEELLDEWRPASRPGSPPRAGALQPSDLGTASPMSLEIHAAALPAAILGGEVATPAPSPPITTVQFAGLRSLGMLLQRGLQLRSPPPAASPVTDKPPPYQVSVVELSDMIRIDLSQDDHVVLGRESHTFADLLVPAEHSTAPAAREIADAFIKQCAYATLTVLSSQGHRAESASFGALHGTFVPSPVLTDVAPKTQSLLVIKPPHVSSEAFAKDVTARLRSMASDTGMPPTLLSGYDFIEQAEKWIQICSQHYGFGVLLLRPPRSLRFSTLTSLAAMLVAEGVTVTLAEVDEWTQFVTHPDLHPLVQLASAASLPSSESSPGFSGQCSLAMSDATKRAAEIDWSAPDLRVSQPLVSHSFVSSLSSWSTSDAALGVDHTGDVTAVLEAAHRVLQEPTLQSQGGSLGACWLRGSVRLQAGLELQALARTCMALPRADGALPDHADLRMASRSVVCRSIVALEKGPFDLGTAVGALFVLGACGDEPVRTGVRAVIHEPCVGQPSEGGDSEGEVLVSGQRCTVVWWEEGSSDAAIVLQASQRSLLVPVTALRADPSVPAIPPAMIESLFTSVQLFHGVREPVGVVTLITRALGRIAAELGAASPGAESRDLASQGAGLRCLASRCLRLLWAVNSASGASLTDKDAVIVERFANQEAWTVDLPSIGLDGMTGAERRCLRALQLHSEGSGLWTEEELIDHTEDEPLPSTCTPTLAVAMASSPAIETVETAIARCTDQELADLMELASRSKQRKGVLSVPLPMLPRGFALTRSPMVVGLNLFGSVVALGKMRRLGQRSDMPKYLVADRSIPTHLPMFYFECVLHGLEDAPFSIGLLARPPDSPPSSPFHSPPVHSWTPCSVYWETRGDAVRMSAAGVPETVRVTAGAATPTGSGPPETQRTVFGCGWDLRSKRVFFTREGQVVDSPALVLDPEVVKDVLPTVLMEFGEAKPSRVRVNFGQNKFVANIDDLLQRFRYQELALAGASLPPPQAALLGYCRAMSQSLRRFWKTQSIEMLSWVDTGPEALERAKAVAGTVGEPGLPPQEHDGPASSSASAPVRLSQPPCDCFGRRVMVQNIREFGFGGELSDDQLIAMLIARGDNAEAVVNAFLMGDASSVSPAAVEAVRTRCQGRSHVAVGGSDRFPTPASSGAPFVGTCLDHRVSSRGAPLPAFPGLQGVLVPCTPSDDGRELVIHESVSHPGRTATDLTGCVVLCLHPDRVNVASLSHTAKDRGALAVLLVAPTDSIEPDDPAAETASSPSASVSASAAAGASASVSTRAPREGVPCVFVTQSEGAALWEAGMHTELPAPGTKPGSSITATLAMGTVPPASTTSPVASPTPKASPADAPVAHTFSSSTGVKFLNGQQLANEVPLSARNALLCTSDQPLSALGGESKARSLADAIMGDPDAEDPEQRSQWIDTIRRHATRAVAGGPRAIEETMAGVSSTDPMLREAALAPLRELGVPIPPFPKRRGEDPVFRKKHSALMTFPPLVGQPVRTGCIVRVSPHLVQLMTDVTDPRSRQLLARIAGRCGRVQQIENTRRAVDGVLTTGIALVCVEDSETTSVARLWLPFHALGLIDHDVWGIEGLADAELDPARLQAATQHELSVAESSVGLIFAKRLDVAQGLRSPQDAALSVPLTDAVASEVFGAMDMASASKACLTPALAYILSREYAFPADPLGVMHRQRLAASDIASEALGLSVDSTETVWVPPLQGVVQGVDWCDHLPFPLPDPLSELGMLRVLNESARGQYVAALEFAARCITYCTDKPHSAVVTSSENALSDWLEWRLTQHVGDTQRFVGARVLSAARQIAASRNTVDSAGVDSGLGSTGEQELLRPSVDTEDDLARSRSFVVSLDRHLCRMPRAGSRCVVRCDADTSAPPAVLCEATDSGLQFSSRWVSGRSVSLVLEGPNGEPSKHCRIVAHVYSVPDAWWFALWSASRALHRAKILVSALVRAASMAPVAELRKATHVWLNAVHHLGCDCLEALGLPDLPALVRHQLAGMLREAAALTSHASLLPAVEWSSPSWFAKSVVSRWREGATDCPRLLACASLEWERQSFFLETEGAVLAPYVQLLCDLCAQLLLQLHREVLVASTDRSVPLEAPWTELVFRLVDDASKSSASRTDFVLPDLLVRGTGGNREEGATPSSSQQQTRRRPSVAASAAASARSPPKPKRGKKEAAVRWPGGWRIWEDGAYSRVVDSGAMPASEVGVKRARDALLGLAHVRACLSPMVMGQGGMVPPTIAARAWVSAGLLSRANLTAAGRSESLSGPSSRAGVVGRSATSDSIGSVSSNDSKKRRRHRRGRKSSTGDAEPERPGTPADISRADSEALRRSFLQMHGLDPDSMDAAATGGEDEDLRRALLMSLEVVQTEPVSEPPSVGMGLGLPADSDPFRDPLEGKSVPLEITTALKHALELAEREVWTVEEDVSLVRWVEQLDRTVVSRRSSGPKSLWHMSLRTLLSDPCLALGDSIGRSESVASTVSVEEDAGDVSSRSQELLARHEALKGFGTAQIRRRILALSVFQAAMHCSSPCIDWSECMGWATPGTDPANPWALRPELAAVRLPASLTPRIGWFSVAQLCKYASDGVERSLKAALVRQALDLTAQSQELDTPVVRVDRGMSLAVTGVGVTTSSKAVDWPGKAEGLGCSLLEQVAAVLTASNARVLRQRGSASRVAFRTVFLWEDVVGDMGPYRAVFADSSRELQATAGLAIARAPVSTVLGSVKDAWTRLPITAPSPNADSHDGIHNDRMVWAHDSADSYGLRLVETLGALVGCAIRTHVLMGLPLSQSCWSLASARSPSVEHLHSTAAHLASECSGALEDAGAASSTGGGPEDAWSQLLPTARRLWGEANVIEGGTISASRRKSGAPPPVVNIERPVWASWMREGSFVPEHSTAKSSIQSSPWLIGATLPVRLAAASILRSMHARVFGATSTLGPATASRAGRMSDLARATSASTDDRSLSDIDDECEDLVVEDSGLVSPGEAVAHSAAMVRALVLTQVPQTAAFRTGLSHCLSLTGVELLNAAELETLVCGEDSVNVDLLRAHTTLKNASIDTPQVQWLFQVLESWDEDKRAEFAAFGCGQSRLPSTDSGYREANLRMQVEILTVDSQMSKHPSKSREEVQHILDGRLVTAFACFFNVSIPEYSSKELLEERLLTAIREAGQVMNLDNVRVGADGMARVTVGT